MKRTNEVLSYFMMVVLGTFLALDYYMFVFPNSFAPGGVDGFCTMIQYIFKFNIGYLSLIFNVPLLIASLIILDKRFVAKTVIFILTFSVVSILPDHVDMTFLLYYTENGTSTVLAPIVAGVIRGLLYVVTIKFGGCAGGVDIIAEIIHKYKPHIDLMNIIFIINVCVAVMAYFVYGFSIEPTICSIVYTFVSRTVSMGVQAGLKERVRFEIITEYSEKLCQEIGEILGQKSKIVSANTTQDGVERKMVICVVDKKAVPKLEKLVKSYPDAIMFESLIKNAYVYDRTI
jgi:uncharacterized membrane-anchored protein YitT (DUF2179 family)